MDPSFPQLTLEPRPNSVVLQQGGSYSLTDPSGCRFQMKTTIYIPFRWEDTCVAAWSQNIQAWLESWLSTTGCAWGISSAQLPASWAEMNLGLLGKKGLYVLPQYEHLHQPGSSSYKKEPHTQVLIPTHGKGCIMPPDPTVRRWKHCLIGIRRRIGHQRKHLSLLIFLLGLRIIKERIPFPHTW